MDESFAKGDELGTSIDETKIAGVGLGFWATPVSNPVANK